MRVPAAYQLFCLPVTGWYEELVVLNDSLTSTTPPATLPAEITPSPPT